MVDKTERDEESATQNIHSSETKHDSLAASRHRRSNVRLIVVCLILMGVVAAVGVAVAKIKDDTKGSAYKENAKVDIYQGCGRALEGNECKQAYFGRKVRLSSDGNRLFVAASSRAMAGTIQIFDYDKAKRMWTRSAVLDPPGILEEIEFYDFDVDKSGQRLALSYKESRDFYVRIFEESDGDGSWNQIGETLDGFFLKLNAETYAGGRVINNVTNAYSWGFSLSMSRDGSTIAVGAPRVGYWRNFGPKRYFVTRAGIVQVMQDSSREDDVEMYPNRTWFPLLDEPIKGYLENDLYGERVHITGPSDNILVRSEHLGNECKSGELTAYIDFSSSNNDNNKIAESSDSFETFYRQDARFKPEIMASSADGMILVISSPNYLPSAYEEKPYQGELSIYKFISQVEGYSKVSELLGSESFLHLGTSVAIAADYTIIAGTASSKQDTTPVNYLEVFRYKTEKLDHSGKAISGDFWIRDEGGFFGETKNHGWWSVDVSADGRRVVAGAPDDFVKFDITENKGTWTASGSVAVFDLN